MIVDNSLLESGSAELVSVVLGWFGENFPCLQYDCWDGENYQFQLWPVRDSVNPRVAVLSVFDGVVQFYRSMLDMGDPDFFENLRGVVKEYFGIE